MIAAALAWPEAELEWCSELVWCSALGLSRATELRRHLARNAVCLCGTASSVLWLCWVWGRSGLNSRGGDRLSICLHPYLSSVVPRAAGCVVVLQM